MVKLIYLTPTSLDGFIADESGAKDWSAPDEDAFAFMTEVVRPIGTYLYGRKTYETMSVWQTPEVITGRTEALLEFAKIWQAAGKIVYSKSLETVSTPNTRLERELDPRAVGELKARSSRDIFVGGPTLAAQSIRTGLVDEYRFFVVPALLGGGLRVLPSDVRLKLKLLDEQRFGEGWVYLRYGAQA